jgi:hypothetical protein
LIQGGAGLLWQKAIRFDGIKDGANGDTLHGSGQVDIQAGYTSFTVYSRRYTVVVGEQAPAFVGVENRPYKARGYYIRNGNTPNEMSYSGWGVDRGSRHSTQQDVYGIWTQEVSNSNSMLKMSEITASGTFDYSTSLGGLSPVNDGYYLGGFVGSEARNFNGFRFVEIARGGVPSSNRSHVGG